jgi:nitrile hydratase accessory protein
VSIDLTGGGAPPRRNGELVFEAPWEGRAFGVAVALAARGVYAWDDFRASLIEEIGAAEGRRYYAAWVASLERLLVGRGVLDEAEIDRRAAELAHDAQHAHNH